MKIACLCPVIVGHYPELLANSIACYLQQTYPAHLRRLLILDDVGQLRPQVGEGWEIRSTRERASSLPAKYGQLLAWDAGWADAYAVWDHDDVYLPSHLDAAALPLLLDRPGASHVHPRSFYSTHPLGAVLGRHQRFVCETETVVVAEELATGRMHGALVVSAWALQQVGGWLGVMPAGEERRADFDQRMLAALERLGSPSRPSHEPTYVYRWSTIPHAHCSGLMRSPSDQSWYEAHLQSLGPVPFVDLLAPQHDREALDLILRWCRHVI